MNYFQLNQGPETLGGRDAVVNKPREQLEELYDQIFDLEESILAVYGLPPTYSNRAILFDYINEESNIELTIERLKAKAEAFINSTPKRDSIKVMDGLKEDMDCSDVFPEIGIPDHIYTRFLYEEVLPAFLNDPNKVEEIIGSIKKVSIANLSMLGDYYHHGEKRKR